MGIVESNRSGLLTQELKSPMFNSHLKKQVFNSTHESWNAIDPNLFVDDDGKWYLTFGSFSSGIWQYEMDPSTGFIKAGAQAVQLADNRGTGIEASGLFKKGITSNNVRKRETNTCPTRSYDLTICSTGLGLKMRLK
jgi:hypothetical protein